MSDEIYAVTLLAIAKWFTNAGVFWLVGVCVFRIVLDERASNTALRRESEYQLIRHGLWALVVLALATFARLYAQTYSSFGLDEPVTAELLWLVADQTRWGGRWTVQLAAVGFASAVMALVVSRCRWGWRLLAVAAVGVVGTIPMTGHAYAYIGGFIGAMSLQVGHLLAAGVWIGTLSLLVLIGLRQLFQSPVGQGNVGLGVLMIRTVDRFSPVALVAAGVLTLTGVLTAVLYVDDFEQLWETPYGRLLLAKMGLFGVTAGLGAYNWRMVRPKLAEPGGAKRLRYSATAELLVAATVLALTAWLVHLPMPHE